MLTVLLTIAPQAVFARKGTDPVSTCAAAKLMAAGIGAKAVLVCYERAAAGGKTVSPACVTGADRRVSAAFHRAEQHAGCATTGDAAGISGRLDAQAAAAALALRPTSGRSKCATGELRAIGIGAVAFLRTRAKYAVRPDQGQFESGRAASRAQLQHAFSAAVRKSGCATKDPALADTYAERIAGLAGPLRARLEATKLIQIEPAARSEILAARAEFEANGFGVAEDGSLLTGTPNPLGGWLVVLGDAQGRSMADDGVVVLDVPAAAPFEGEIHHPSDDAFVTGPVYLPDLAADGEAVHTISFEVQNHGPCGMNSNPADDPDQCHAASTTARAHAHGRAALNPDRHQFPPKVTRELGTYPNDALNAVQTACLDYDGYHESTTDRGSTSLVGIVSYPGSTCNMQVAVGCCDNEAADVRRNVDHVSDPVKFPILMCTENHHYRFCQSVTKGDVSLRVHGDILKAGQMAEYEVMAGENVPITVHNNGCYGNTHLMKGAFSSFLPIGGHLNGDGVGGGTLQHYSGAASGYIPDREISYEAPSPCPSDETAVVRRDEYAFETDGAQVSVRFKCPTTTTTTLACSLGAAERSGRAACTPGWYGTITYARVIEQIYSYDKSYEARSDNDRAEQHDTWTFTHTTPGIPGDTVDMVDATWAGTYTQNSVAAFQRHPNSSGCWGCTPARSEHSEASGSATGQQQFQISLDEQVPGRIGAGQVGQLNTIPFTGSHYEDLCCLPAPRTLPFMGGVSEGTVTFFDFLSPDPMDPDHYSGTQISGHTETPLDGGHQLYDERLQWDFRRVH